MQLTTQMHAEMGTIQTRVDHISIQVWIPLETEWMRRCKMTDEDVNIINAVNAELNPYKVRLENILCETDMKEQAQSNKQYIELYLIRFSTFLKVTVHLLTCARKNS